MTAASRDSIATQLEALHQHIPNSVRLIAVTKRFPSPVIRAAYAAGIRDFGESQVQEAETKQAELADLSDITWHLIGHLQSNKVRRALEHFDWVHSLDSLKLAKKLDQAAAELARQPYCCLQVKLVSDPPKYGFDVADLWPALPQLDRLQNLRIVGLMTIPPLGLSRAETETVFHSARSLGADINAANFDRIRIEQLSMGMSGDYPMAIAAGSTMVRLGTYLFGERP